MNANTNTPKTAAYTVEPFELNGPWAGEAVREALYCDGDLKAYGTGSGELEALAEKLNAAAPQPEAASTEAPYPPMPAGWFHTNAEMLAFADATVAQRAAQAPTAVQASVRDKVRATILEFHREKIWAAGWANIPDLLQDAIRMRAALATAAVQGDASSVPTPVVTVAGQVGAFTVAFSDDTITAARLHELWAASAPPGGLDRTDAQDATAHLAAFTRAVQTECAALAAASAGQAGGIEVVARWLASRDGHNPDQVLDINPTKYAWQRNTGHAKHLLAALAAASSVQPADPREGHYRKKPVVIQAAQWFKHGDHPAVVECNAENPNDPTSREPLAAGYGWVPTLEGGHIVTPGDWIITGIKGENYPCKDEIFRMTYEQA